MVDGSVRAPAVSCPLPRLVKLKAWAAEGEASPQLVNLKISDAQLMVLALFCLLTWTHANVTKLNVGGLARAGLVSVPPVKKSMPMSLGEGDACPETRSLCTCDVIT